MHRFCVLDVMFVGAIFLVVFFWVGCLVIVSGFDFVFGCGFFLVGCLGFGFVFLFSFWVLFLFLLWSCFVLLIVVGFCGL